jgi:hypothetical protein
MKQTESKVRRKTTFGNKIGPDASKRHIRRMAGLVHRVFSDNLLKRVTDPRSLQGRRWKEGCSFLRAALLALACGCKGPTELEALTSRLSKTVRRLLGISRRVPDTTIRDFLVNVSVEELQELLHIVGYDAWRRKMLPKHPQFPFHALSMDGKYPSFNDPNQYEYLQHRHDKNTGEYLYSVIRTITATLVTAPGRPILGAVPVPSHTNEMGTFQQAFGDYVRIYGRLFDVVMYDAGASSEDNAKAVRTAGKHYFFQIADPRWTLYETIEYLLKKAPVVARTDEKITGTERVVRELSMQAVEPSQAADLLWPHTQTLFKVYSKTYKAGQLVGTKMRYFVTSMPSTTLDPDRWLQVVVMRWGVETSHQILDTAFKEDKRPWFKKNAQGALVVMLLRRIVYTVMTLFKSRTQRAEDKQLAPWRELFEDIRDAMKMATEQDVEGLRSRTYHTPAALVA